MGIIRYKPKDLNVIKLKKFLNKSNLSKNILIVKKDGNITK